MRAGAPAPAAAPATGKKAKMLQRAPRSGESAKKWQKVAKSAKERHEGLHKTPIDNAEKDTFSDFLKLQQEEHQLAGAPVPAATPVTLKSAK